MLGIRRGSRAGGQWGHLGQGPAARACPTTPSTSRETRAIDAAPGLAPPWGHGLRWGKEATGRGNAGQWGATQPCRASLMGAKEDSPGTGVDC